MFLLTSALLISCARAAIHYVDVNSTNPVAPYTNWDTAAVTIQDAENASANGDEIVVTNGVYATGGTSESRIAISKAAFVHSVNGPEATMIQGYQPPATTNGSGSIRCASLAGTTLAGFTLTNGASQAAGGGALGYSGVSVVSNCVIVGNVALYGGGAQSAKLIDCTLAGNFARVYGGGTAFSTMLNCLLITNTAANNAADGGGAFQGTLTNCVLSGNSARIGGGARYCNLYYCTLSNNIAANNGLGGGGAEECVLENCALIKNSSGNGGGAYQSTLNNCVLNGNLGGSQGGGAYDCNLTNCLVLGNSAALGGGSYLGSGYAVNCTVISNAAGTGGGLSTSVPSAPRFQAINTILYFNSATNGPNIYDFGSDQIVLGWCCTPNPANTTTVTNEPLFVNPGGGDFRLLPLSTCINAGRNSYMANAADLDGNPRIAGGTVDIGAYEFQNPLSVISYAWLQRYGLPTDGSVDFADSDGDGMNNWQEWVTNTDPTNSLSYLRMLPPDGTNNAAGVTFHWQSAGIRYFLQRSTNLAGPFDTFATNFFAGVGIATYRDATATNTGPYFYRVGVQP
jgi:hypothetical protein